MHTVLHAWYIALGSMHAANIPGRRRSEGARYCWPVLPVLPARTFFSVTPTQPATFLVAMLGSHVWCSLARSPAP